MYQGGGAGGSKIEGYQLDGKRVDARLQRGSSGVATGSQPGGKHGNPDQLLLFSVVESTLPW